uniref:SHSP domain-containing protein n=1 Tax=Heterorhabditis bacteriophora TaxID=37862 RepID=A0A1I7XE03_HETBA
MTTYNHSSSYNRTYEKKVIEETPRIRITSHSPFATHHVIPPSFSSFPSSYSFGGNIGSVHTTDDSFTATLDLSQFKPEDLKVSVIGQYIVIEGKHGEKEDELGLIERHFIRKFALPKNIQPEDVTSNLTSEGTLTVQAFPPKPKESSPARSIPIKIVTPSLSSQTSPISKEDKADEKETTKTVQ